MTRGAQLAVDIQALQVGGFADRGIGRYTAGLLGALARTGRIAAALLAPELPPPSGLPAEISASDVVCWDTIQQMRELLGRPLRVVHHVTAPFLHSGPADPSGLTVVPHWSEAGVPRVVILYDLIPLRDPSTYLPSPAHRCRYQARADWVASSDLVLAISEFTRTEAIELLGCAPDKVVTIGAGVASIFTPPDGTDVELFAFHLRALEGRPFVLTIGGSDSRKGTERLIGAMGRLRSAGFDLSLVVVGDLTDSWRAKLAEAARSSGVGDRLLLTGPVSDELLRACYRRAVVTVMPSMAEGFGLPVLESAACGTPALTSSTTALPEVAASPLAIFDPSDIDAMATVIGETLASDERMAAILEMQQDLAARSTWDSVAARTVAAIDRLSERLSPYEWGRAPDRTRLALVGPVPPLGGGIGGYNARLLEALPSFTAVDLVTSMIRAPDLPGGVGHFPSDAFGADARPASYDSLVYALGNSDGHLSTVELALRFPGWLWMHETRLPAIAVTALEGLDDRRFVDSFRWLLERSYRGRVPHHAARRAGRSVLDLVNGGVGFVPLLAERCRGFLVNSHAARRMLELDLAPLVHRPPVHVLPPACPPPRITSVPPAPGNDLLVVAFGVVSMAKRPDLLVDAAAFAGCELAFVGPCPPVLAQMIGERADARGIADRVEVVGPVDDADWKAWLERAVLAVQLRESSSGESSAAVLEALAAGTPVVTNLVAAAEYGTTTVSFLSSLDPSVVGERIRGLLDSAVDRKVLSQAGLEFAAEYQFEHLAEALVRVTTS